MSNTFKVVQVFAQALGIPQNSVKDDLAYNTIQQWDSTAHLVLISEIESAFDVLLDTEDVINLSSVAKARSILEKYEVVFDE